MTESISLLACPSGFPQARDRALVMEELRRLLGAGKESGTSIFPFGLAALDTHLPEGGLSGAALHEIVPATAGANAAAFGFIVAILARLPPPRPIIFVMPAYGHHQHGRLSGHGLNALGLDPGRVILVETAHRKESLWALAEALHSAAPAAVVGIIDRLDLKTSQKLQLTASDCGLPLLLLRPAPTLEASAATTRWRVGTAEAARDRFGLYACPRWHLHLERCRNGRPGEWVVEYDHVAHRFSLAAALADPALCRGTGDRSASDRCSRQAGRS
ncbi:MAG: ImuA protein [Xanthobacteraceae bacterium]|jgi:protein ImuA